MKGYISLLGRTIKQNTTDRKSFMLSRCVSFESKLLFMITQKKALSMVLQQIPRQFKANQSRNSSTMDSMQGRSENNLTRSMYLQYTPFKNDKHYYFAHLSVHRKNETNSHNSYLPSFLAQENFETDEVHCHFFRTFMNLNE